MGENIDLTDPIFHDVDAARSWLEASRWPEGVYCPHCGSTAPYRMGGKARRPGLFHCPDCRGQFTVLTGSVMESSHIPLPKWVLGINLMAGSKKGVSAHQLHRSLGITYKSAWFMAHRLREAMSLPPNDPIGGEGKIVEADEAYLGRKKNPEPSPHRKGKAYIKSGKAATKRPIVALVERGGEARAEYMPRVTSENIKEFMQRHADRKSRLQTDESNLYPSVGTAFAAHETVNHGAKEYARGDVNTNSVEGFFGVFKRGMKGIYQHCGEQHFQRYLDEFTFRHNTRSKLGIDDAERAERITKAMNGKRLTYRRISGTQEGASSAFA
jgi:transposase-like protein